LNRKFFAAALEERELADLVAARAHRLERAALDHRWPFRARHRDLEEVRDAPHLAAGPFRSA
jgi:hypothetical protein